MKGFVGSNIGYYTLKALSSRGRDVPEDYVPERDEGQRKLEIHFGPSVWDEMRGKTVIDFGCGTGLESVALCENGAKRVIGIDISDSRLAEAERRARDFGVADRCTFAKETQERGDVVFSLDSFEHFDDPEAILNQMIGLAAPGGQVLISFGWPWYHPYGGHLFSIFPWAHLIFTEQAFIRWRSDFKSDGATRFHEVEGGLNGMSIRRFHSIIEKSPHRSAQINLVPIRPLRWLHNRFTREFTTALVQCRLVTPSDSEN